MRGNRGKVERVSELLEENGVLYSIAMNSISSSVLEHLQRFCLDFSIRKSIL